MGDPDRLFDECKRIAARLLQSAPVDALEAITPEGTERGFEVLARAVRDSIEKNEPAAGLDRLHTFVTNLIRTLSQKRDVTIDRDKPLHSIFGEYVKTLRGARLIESEMTERILRSSISTMEAFNRVRNDTSLAHDNPTLNYDESLLIFNPFVARFGSSGLSMRARRAHGPPHHPKRRLKMRSRSDSTHNNGMHRTALRAAADAERCTFPAIRKAFCRRIRVEYTMALLTHKEIVCRS